MNKDEMEALKGEIKKDMKIELDFMQFKLFKGLRVVQKDDTDMIMQRLGDLEIILEKFCDVDNLRK
jgi:hypothetical protein